MKRCPYCAEEIQDAAIVCKHCGRDLKFGASAFPQPWEAEAKALALKGDLIPAIKMVRQGSGLGLAEAKAMVERWRHESPTAAPVKSGGCGVVVIVLVVIAVAALAIVAFMRS